MRLVKLFVLWLAKHLGGFGLAQRLTSGQLRILCYHGVWVGDRPRMGEKLFMEPETFRQRLMLLKREGFRVVPLGQAVAELASGNLPPKTVVITIDDGWATTRSHMLPALREVGFPSTLYLTSYYVEKAAPVLNIFINFVWQRARAGEAAQRAAICAVIAEAQAQGAAPDLDVAALEAAPLARGRAAFAALIEALPDMPGRLARVRRLADMLDVDIRPAVRGRWFDLMTPEELHEVMAAGMDVQLHTHRHRFKDASPAESHREIVENRAKIVELLGLPPESLVHFCYPSGNFSEGQWPVLAALGVQTATTILEGLNSAETARYGLKRFLDGENVTMLEFESYLSGFSELLVRMKAWLRPWRRPAPQSEAAAAHGWALNNGALLSAAPAPKERQAA